ncbi:MAG: replicative DNA helicase [Chloroflexi bacterium]|nr:replicative DNA helicase [Chloroflexota bacterium]
MSLEKLPPHDVESEEAVLGSLLIDDGAIVEVSDLLLLEDFYREQNRLVYEACLSLYEGNKTIDQVTLAHELSRRSKLEEVGGPAYLSHLVMAVPTSVHARYYAQNVHRLGVMRRLIDAAGRIAALGYEASSDADSVLNNAEDILFRLRHGQSGRDFVHIREVLDQYFEETGPAQEQGRPRLPHVLTGFTILDEMLGGFQRSDLVILGARPSLGKTSLAMNIARNAAVDHKAHVAIFSLEMSKEQLVHRLLASESGVDSKRVRLGLHTEAEERRIMEATGILSEAPIYIDDSPLIRIVELRSKARRLHYDQGIDLIIVDFLQLIRSGFNIQNPVQEMSEISRSLKALARELNIPLLAVSQLSRAVEQRSPHIPMLSDLRESGSIEQDADVVLFIYREDYYTTREDWEKRFPGEPYPKGKTNIIVAKHRNGPTGQVDLEFDHKTVKFKNYPVGGLVG